MLSLSFSKLQQGERVIGQTLFPYFQASRDLVELETGHLAAEEIYIRSTFPSSHSTFSGKGLIVGQRFISNTSRTWLTYLKA
jgi:hypothetical protein